MTFYYSKIILSSQIEDCALTDTMLTSENPINKSRASNSSYDGFPIYASSFTISVMS